MMLNYCESQADIYIVIERIKILEILIGFFVDIKQL